MSTPNKHTVKAAELMPSLESLFKALIKSNLGIEIDFDTMVRTHSFPDEVKKGFTNHRELLNKAYNIFKDIDFELRQIDNSTRQAFLWGEEEMMGRHKVENMTINTSLYNKAPRLTPRVGYDEAMKRLNTLRPRKGDNDKITIRQLAGCLGQVGSESHIIEFWTMAVPEDKEREPIKTYKILNVITPDGMVYFAHAKEFIKRLYENYYLGLITGKIVAISSRSKGKVVRFVD